MCLAASLTFIVFASLLAPLFALLAVVPFSPLLLFLLLPIVVPNWFTSSWFQFWIEEGREPKEWVVPSVFFCCTVGHYLPILTLFVCSCSLRFIHWSLVLLPFHWLLLLSIRNEHTHNQSYSLDWWCLSCAIPGRRRGKGLPTVVNWDCPSPTTKHFHTHHLTVDAMKKKPPSLPINCRALDSVAAIAAAVF